MQIFGKVLIFLSFFLLFSACHRAEKMESLSVPEENQSEDFEISKDTEQPAPEPENEIPRYVSEVFPLLCHEFVNMVRVFGKNEITARIPENGFYTVEERDKNDKKLAQILEIVKEIWKSTSFICVYII